MVLYKIYISNIQHIFTLYIFFDIILIERREGMVKTKSFLLKMDEDLKKELEEEAKEKGLPLSYYIRMILLERNKA